eukprot:TRINITY_DN722_c0_g1_i1.p1 TRINITY_DN722_c0_g1~~TRINITY_DN722_c0_g1_i1.p1  ORF type:complete len:233 (+),score=22.05 TRINITY_DN722_c0_g1_i1:357-1055(+)
MRDSVALVKSARDVFSQEQPLNRSYPLVAASIGSYGAILPRTGAEYSGAFSLNAHELAEFHFPRMQTLCEAQPDLLMCETIPKAEEAEGLAMALRRLPSQSACISFSCASVHGTACGDSIERCVDAALQAQDQLLGIGVNCTSPSLVKELISRIHSHLCRRKPAHLPEIVAYPNNGDIYRAEQGLWEPGSTEPLPTFASAWAQAGARIIGGCCRVTPADIASLREKLELHFE